MTEKKEESANTKKSKNVFQKHPFTFILLGALLISILWGVLNANRIEKGLSEKYEKKIEQLEIKSAEQLIHYFSLAIRSEWTRNNKEQANQYLLELLKDERISKVMLVEQGTNKVLFSSNKKDENKKMENEFIISTTNTKSESISDELIVATPVMGLNSQMGVLVCYFKK